MVAIRSKYIPYDGIDPLNGIIGYFRSITGTKDPYQKGLIDIYASATEDKKSYVFVDESDWNSGYWYASGIGNWITIDFGLNKVALSHYTVKAWGQDYFKEWIFEASNDNLTWITIHDGKMASMPTNVLMNMTFKTDKFTPKRYVRLRNTVNRFAGNNGFYIHRLEFFGKFFSSQDASKNVHCNYRGILGFYVSFFTSFLIS